MLWIFVSNLITQSCSLGMLCMCVCVCVCTCVRVCMCNQKERHGVHGDGMNCCRAEHPSTHATKLNNPRSSTPLEVQSTQIQLRKQFLLEACVCASLNSTSLLLWIIELDGNSKRQHDPPPHHPLSTLNSHSLILNLQSSILILSSTLILILSSILILLLFSNPEPNPES
jgi:hypothetical protein